MKMNTQPSYVASPNLLTVSDSIYVIKQRASLVHSLIYAYGLTKKLKLISSLKASEDDVRKFHSEDYVQYLKVFSTTLPSEDEVENVFGLGFDCPPLQDTWLTVRELAGASLCAADSLINGDSTVAMNWYGGWHHAHRDSASGFCYVNDIVLAIQRLRGKFDKILYVDLDVHHGDGVENAFSFTPKVLTLSLHQLEPGFFPGTGDVNNVGFGKGRFYSVNVPYKAGITDSQLNYLLKGSLQEINNIFVPDAVVCQCGADTLAQDPLGDANVSLEGYINCIRQILSLGLPTLFLGGGGYNKTNAAKLWTAITFLSLNEAIPEEIPEHPWFPLYGPDFTMSVTASLRKSENSQASLDQVLTTVKENLRNLRTANCSSLTT